MASGREFRAQLRAALAAKARQQRIARAKWQRAAPQPGPGAIRIHPKDSGGAENAAAEQHPTQERLRQWLTSRFPASGRRR